MKRLLGKVDGGIVYHGTSSINAQNILSEGLKAKSFVDINYKNTYLYAISSAIKDRMHGLSAYPVIFGINLNSIKENERPRLLPNTKNPMLISSFIIDKNIKPENISIYDSWESKKMWNNVDLLFHENSLRPGSEESYIIQKFWEWIANYLGAGSINAKQVEQLIRSYIITD